MKKISTLILAVLTVFLVQASKNDVGNNNILKSGKDLKGGLPEFLIKGDKTDKYDTVQIQTSAKCHMCEERLEHDISFEKGVKSVDLDMDTKVLTVVYRKGKNTDEGIKVAVTKVGYDADEMPADQKAHDRLPECCQSDVDPH